MHNQYNEEEWRKHPNAVRGKHTGIRQTGSLALQQASAFLYIHPGADWPLGAPERFPVAWRLIWPAALFFYIYIFLLLFFLFFISFAFPMCQSDHFRLWHSLINHKSVSLDRQRRASRLFLASVKPTLSHGNLYIFYEVANSYEFVRVI